MIHGEGESYQLQLKDDKDEYFGLSNYVSKSDTLISPISYLLANINIGIFFNSS